MRVRIASLALALSIASIARAVDIEGVLPASLDQPRIYLAIARDAKSPPLSAKGGAAGGLEAILADALGEKPKKGDDGEALGVFAVEAFLDTGASGIMLSKPTAESLGIAGIKTRDGKPIRFFDVGIGGKEPFLVTDSFVLRSCEYGANTDGEQIERYAPPLAPIRLKIREESGMMDALTGGLDVAGMPLMWNKVMVVDARPLSKFEKLKTSLVARGDRSIPAAVDSTIALTYVDYARFTQLEPANAPGVSLAPNPMVGPDPFKPGDRTPAVMMTHKGKTASLSMLLDTGAASSFVSSAKARALCIDVDEDGAIKNVPAKDQFSLPIGGIGGAKTVSGFYVDAVALPVARGEPIRYLKAPVLVLDITVTDEKSGQVFTLDGVLGMNYLVASAGVSVSLLGGGGIDDIHDGAFDGFVIDHAAKTLGLQLRK